MSPAISIIDDDQYVCEILKRSFINSVPNINIETFTDYIDFLNNYKNNKQDIVILDYDLGNTTALDLVQYIEAINPDVTIFILSGYLDHEGEFCIPKPFDINSLPIKIIKKHKEYKDENIKKMMMLDAILMFIDNRIKNRQLKQTC